MLHTSHAPLQEGQSTDRRIACVAGLRPFGTVQTAVWIRSPKTGRELQIWDGWYGDLKAVAPGILPRVTHARATGQSVVEFTIDELRAFAALVEKIAEHCKPKYVPGKPGVHASYGRSPGRRRGWINR